MTDYSDDHDEAIDKAMKELPYFAPSAQFADKVMARVRVPGSIQAPAAVPARRIEPVWSAPVARRTSDVVAPDIRRSVPARIAAAALVASVGMTMTVALLVSFFDLNLFVLLSRIFGQSTMTYLAAVATETSASAAATASSSVAAAGTAVGAAVVGSFAAGAIAATAVIRAAANSHRRAA